MRVLNVIRKEEESCVRLMMMMPLPWQGEAITKKQVLTNYERGSCNSIISQLYLNRKSNLNNAVVNFNPSLNPNKFVETIKLKHRSITNCQ